MKKKRPTADDSVANSVVEYKQYVLSAKSSMKLRLYRGQANNVWKPQPSIMRGYRPDAEAAAITELLTESPDDFRTDASMFERLVRAQHYKLPTRLLDVSLNPLVGLFFACYDADTKYQKDDGAVFMFDSDHDRVKNYNSDTISIICNLALLADEEREALKAEVRRLDKARDDDEFRKMSEIKRLCQFVRAEKPHFLNEIDPIDLRRYYVVLPRKTNRRIIAQSGAFIAAGLLEYISLDSSSAFETQKIRIPASSKESILRDLDSLNINSRTMFPDIENISEYIKSKWK